MKPSAYARVSKEKLSPRCLRKLYQMTKESMKTNLALLLEQMVDRQLKQKRPSVGWEA